MKYNQKLINSVHAERHAQVALAYPGATQSFQAPSCSNFSDSAGQAIPSQTPNTPNSQLQPETGGLIVVIGKIGQDVFRTVEAIAGLVAPIGIIHKTSGRILPTMGSGEREAVRRLRKAQIERKRQKQWLSVEDVAGKIIRLRNVE